MTKKSLAFATLGLCVLPAAVLAVPTPYGNSGTINPVTYTFTATGTGPITAYFVGESASYGSTIGLSINGAAPLTFGLQNHLSGYGTTFNMGNVNAGDVLRFVLNVATSSYYGPPPLTYSLNSDASLNPNGENHIYAYAYGGDAGSTPVGGSPIPAGTYIGFEDISPLANGDKDYNDHQFVFTGVTGTPNVADGGMTVAMLQAPGMLRSTKVTRPSGERASERPMSRASSVCLPSATDASTSECGSLAGPPPTRSASVADSKNSFNL